MHPAQLQDVIDRAYSSKVPYAYYWDVLANTPSHIKREWQGIHDTLRDEGVATVFKAMWPHLMRFLRKTYITLTIPETERKYKDE